LTKDLSLTDNIEQFFRSRYESWTGGDQFIGTGNRLKRMMEELCWEPSKIEQELRKCLVASYPDKYNEMLVSGPTSVWTLCPHHLVPCNFKVWIGYIPNGRVLGLSKFSRLAIISAKRPIMQETYSAELADFLMKNFQPKGIGVYVVGTHGCMFARGVGQEVPVSTNMIRGEFLKPEVRNEFFSIVKGQ
jgi:GTP cyclohydrolase I